MKCFSLVLVIAAFLFSCNNAGKDKNADGSDSATVNPPANTRTIADAIPGLKSTLESKDPESIANLIDFPLEEPGALHFTLDDSVYYESYKAAGRKVTRPMFIKYFNSISKNTYLDKVIDAFKYISLDSLKINNDITKEFRDTKEPCYETYRITVEDSIVKIIYGTSINPKSERKEKIEEGAGCEYYSLWEFRLDGNRLKFSRQEEPG